jgi:hypothetical protein
MTYTLSADKGIYELEIADAQCVGTPGNADDSLLR